MPSRAGSELHGQQHGSRRRHGGSNRRSSQEAEGWTDSSRRLSQESMGSRRSRSKSRRRHGSDRSPRSLAGSGNDHGASRRSRSRSRSQVSEASGASRRSMESLPGAVNDGSDGSAHDRRAHAASHGKRPEAHAPGTAAVRPTVQVPPASNSTRPPEHATAVAVVDMSELSSTPRAKAAGAADAKHGTAASPGAHWSPGQASDHSGGTTSSRVSAISGAAMGEFAVDVGTKEYKHLSYDRAIRARWRAHPHRVVVTDETQAGVHYTGGTTPMTINTPTAPHLHDFASGHVRATSATTSSVGHNGTIEQYPVWSTNTGRHGYCGMPDEDSEFAKYGVGISMYFKYLKAVAGLFTVLTALSIPSMVMFSLGEVSSQGSASSPLLTFGLNSLSRASLGNLGDGRSICKHVDEGQQMEVQCPTGSVIGSLEAYYGQPAGSCSCPQAQLPDPFCPGSPSGDACEPAGSFCHRTSRRKVALPSGSLYHAGSCCAAAKLEDGSLDFREHDVRETPGCNSASATRVARGLCVGRQSCAFAVNLTARHTWDPLGEEDSVGSVQQCRTAAETDAGVCDEALVSGGGLEECITPGTARHMILTARCVQTHAFFGSMRVRKEVIAWYVVVFDVFSVLWVAVWLWWLRGRERAEEGRVKAEHLTAADYTVELMRVPRHDNLTKLEARLRKHFELVLGERRASWKNTPHRVKIADLNFAVRQAKLMAAFRKRGRIVRDLERAQKRAAISRKKTVANLVPVDITRHKSVAANIRDMADETRHELADIDRIIDAEQKRARQQAVRAFITFADRESYLRCVDQYPLGGRWVQPRRLRLHGKYLKIRPAAEPTAIIWENLQFQGWRRVARLALTAAVSLLLVAGSAGVLLSLEQTKRSVLLSTDGADCSLIDGVGNKTRVVLDELWQAYNLTQGRTGRLGCYCDHVLGAEGLGQVLQERFVPEETGLAVPVAAEAGSGDGGGGSSPLQTALNDPLWCVPWASDAVLVQAISIVSALSVVTVNLLLRIVLNWMIPSVERHHSRSEDMASRMNKLFFVQLLNTGFLALIVNARIPVPALQSALGIEGGDHADFTTDWYTTVGTSITLAMMANVFFPHALPLTRAVYQAVRRCWDRSCTCDRSLSKCETQTQYEALYRGPQFHLAERYAQALTTVFVSLAYSTGIPILLPLALVFFLLTYGIDKLLFSRFYRTPPSYDASMAAIARRLTPWALVLHLSIGCWMISNPDVFNATSVASAFAGVDGDLSKVSGAGDFLGNAFNRMLTAHTAPMFVLLVLLLLGVIVDEVLLRNLRWALARCCRWARRKQDTLPYPEYYDAVPLSFLEEALAGDDMKASLRPKYEEVVRRRRAQLAESIRARVARTAGSVGAMSVSSAGGFGPPSTARSGGGRSPVAAMARSFFSGSKDGTDGGDGDAAAVAERASKAEPAAARSMHGIRDGDGGRRDKGRTPSTGGTKRGRRGSDGGDSAVDPDEHKDAFDVTAELRTTSAMGAGTAGGSSSASLQLPRSVSRRTAGSAAKTPGGATSADEESRYITGVPTYDINLNPFYHHMLALDAVVSASTKRGLHLAAHRAGGRKHQRAKSHHSRGPYGNGTGFMSRPIPVEYQLGSKQLDVGVDGRKSDKSAASTVGGSGSVAGTAAAGEDSSGRVGGSGSAGGARDVDAGSDHSSGESSSSDDGGGGGSGGVGADLEVDENVSDDSDSSS